MPKIFKEPLVQFLIGGLFLYGALALFGGVEEENSPYVIPVNDQALLLYLQYQDKAFDTASARKTLDALDEKARTRLEEEYIRDEVMVREAVALGLDGNDEVIRRRLIQKMDFIVQGVIPADIAFEQADIEAHFKENIADYMIDAEATFTHIFFSNEKRGPEKAANDARQLLNQINQINLPFESAGDYGDRFYFLRNYVKRPKRLLSNHFGSEMIEGLLSQQPTNQWIGPFASKYGSHLVMLREFSPARAPGLSEVASLVIEDLRREKRDAVRSAAIARLTLKYKLQRDEAPK